MIEFQLDTASGVATYLQLVSRSVTPCSSAYSSRATSCRPPSRWWAAGHQPQYGAQGLPRPRAGGAGAGSPRQGTFVVGSFPGTDPAAQARFLAFDGRLAALGPLGRARSR